MNKWRREKERFHDDDKEEETDCCRKKAPIVAYEDQTTIRGVRVSTFRVA